MSTIDDFINRKYMHKSDLPEDGSGVVLTIDSCTVETMQDGERKLAASIVEEDWKPCLLNNACRKMGEPSSGSSVRSRIVRYRQ